MALKFALPQLSSPAIHISPEPPCPLPKPPRFDNAGTQRRDDHIRVLRRPPPGLYFFAKPEGQSARRWRCELGRKHRQHRGAESANRSAASSTLPPLRSAAGWKAPSGASNCQFGETDTASGSFSSSKAYALRPPAAPPYRHRPDRKLPAARLAAQPPTTRLRNQARPGRLPASRLEEALYPGGRGRRDGKGPRLGRWRGHGSSQAGEGHAPERDCWCKARNQGGPPSKQLFRVAA